MADPRVLTIPEPGWRISRADRERYAKHAALQSIAAYLKQARRAQASAAEYTAWLEQLHAERLAQIEAGTWPPPKPEEVSLG